MSSNFVPRADNVGNLGKPSKVWNTVYANNVGTETNKVSNIYADKITVKDDLYDKDGKSLNGRLANYVPLANNAASHNALFRGKDLTSYFDSGEMSKAIAANTFDDIFPGDFIKKSITVDGTTYSDIEFVIGDLNYHLHRGDTETTKPHVLIFPRTYLGHARMNASNDTTGGYTGSEMWKTTIPKYATAFQNAFGSDHILSHRELLTNSISATAASAAGANWVGSTNNWAWTDVSVNLFNEPMVYGNHPFSSSAYDIGECNTQVAAMRHDKSLSFTRQYWCWLRAVASASAFAYAASHGDANHINVSYTDGGVRPYSLLT